MDIQEITRRVEKESMVLRQIMAEIEKVVVGQRHLLERIQLMLLHIHQELTYLLKQEILLHKETLMLM